MLLQRLRTIGGVCAVLLLVLSFAFVSSGEEPAGDGAVAADESAVALGDGLGVWAPADDTVLDEVRGTGGSAQISLADLESNVVANEVGDGVVTGDIAIQDAAFSEFSGVQAASFNTGNNVSLQNNVIVNVHLE